jgi:hypothetical protein
MTPEEKAKELYHKFSIASKSFIEGKKCAVIAVDEILKSNPTEINCDSSEFNYDYYIKVKKEIEKL